MPSKRFLCLKVGTKQINFVAKRRFNGNILDDRCFFLRLSLLARGKHITNQRRRLALCLQEVAKSKKNLQKTKNILLLILTLVFAN